MTIRRSFISREEALDVLERLHAPANIVRAISAIPSFPAPNPSEEGGRNIMGQTEDEFWEGVDTIADYQERHKR